MPIIILAGYVVSVLCAVHVVRSGRELYWIVLLLMAPWLGAIIYTLAVILPGQATHRRRRQAVNVARRAIDPDADLRAAEAQAEMSPTAANYKAVGDALMERGRHEAAVKAYDRALSGAVHATDPAFLASKAHALMLMCDYRAVIATLDKLREANPGWSNAYAHLDYAQAFEALGDDARAIEEFGALAIYFPGEEARTRLGLLLEKAGRSEEAKTIWREMMAAERAAPPLYRKQQREWLDIARQHGGGV